MTFSQLRNQVYALRLKYDSDLAVSRLRPVAKQSPRSYSLPVRESPSAPFPFAIN